MNRLVVLLGPTAVGKSDIAASLATLLQSPILSADSRQIYKGMPICTASPTAEQMTAARHYFVQELPLTENYNASRYENDVLNLLNTLFLKHNTVLLSGGSMLYVDAVCKGIDIIPDISADIREQVDQMYSKKGLPFVVERLLQLDPGIGMEIDLKNYKRVKHALEVCLTTNRPYSSFRKHSPQKRNFEIIKIGLYREREDLYSRINKRVDMMIELGLVDEIRNLLPYRQFNALDTVGCKEIMRYLNGEWKLDFAIEKIKRNTRVYARKQLTWFKRDNEIKWFNLTEETDSIPQIIVDYLDSFPILQE